MGQPKPSKEFPFLLTSAKDPVFFHSAYRQIPSLRRISPEPAVQISPETASWLGVSQGDLVWVRTECGKVRQRISILEGLDPRVVCAAYGWWFPEKGMETLLGWEEANLNLLTSAEPPFDPLLASVNLRGIPCSLERIQDASE
jgi:anaerobic selenocysteine-containing dehydrogenase